MEPLTMYNRFLPWTKFHLLKGISQGINDTSMISHSNQSHYIQWYPHCTTIFFFVKSWYPQYTIIFLGEITTCTRQKPSSRWKKPTPSFCRGTADPQISLFWGLCLQLLVICSLRSLGDEGWKVDMLMVKWVACGRYWFMAGLWQTYMIVGEICG